MRLVRQLSVLVPLIVPVLLLLLLVMRLIATLVWMKSLVVVMIITLKKQDLYNDNKYNM